jgi:hypothetical protein
MHSKLRIRDSHKLVQISLNFLFFGVIFFFFPFAGDFGGVAACPSATWLLVTGPGLLIVSAWLLVTGPGLLLVGVHGIALLTETSNHGHGFHLPLLFLQEEAIRIINMQGKKSYHLTNYTK